MKTQIFFSALLAGLVCASVTFAQDPRERNYYYEILNPQHEAKPLVEGFAQSKIKECLNRGLSAVPAVDGKGIYLSWRMLETDAPHVRFDVYRAANGKTKKLNRKVIEATCDFTDRSPVKGEAVYWVTCDGKESEKVKADFSTLHNYRSIRLNRQVKAGKVGVADLNGDGTYDYIIPQIRN